MQRLPKDLEQVVLSYLCIFPCCCTGGSSGCGAAAVCRGWSGAVATWLRLSRQQCLLEGAVACPEMRLCRVHQRAELELWAALWHACHTLHQNPFPLRSPHLDALLALRKRMARHQMPFDVCGVRLRPTPREAWIFIAPGHRGSLWWRRYCEWADLSDDE